MEIVRFIDMFCGIGGFRLGLEKASTQPHERQYKATDTRSQDSMDLRRNRKQTGYQCVWSNDNDRYACQVYRKHFGEVHEGNIRTVDTNAIPEHDLLCAGFPCQSFSIAGKRRGFEDTRGTLFFEICRILQAKRPGMLFLENVKGLLSADEGRTFLTILESLDELGYDCQWQVLNSKDYGVPQNRERVFIIGHTRGTPRPKVFPLGEDGEGANEAPRDHKDGARDLIYAIYNQQFRANQDLAGALKGEGIAATSLGTALLENQQIRRLTPIECERLQGFPDNWTQGISDSQRYKCLGNAVTVNVIEAIGRLLKQSITSYNP